MCNIFSGGSRGSKVGGPIAIKNVVWFKLNVFRVASITKRMMIRIIWGGGAMPPPRPPPGHTTEHITTNVRDCYTLVHFKFIAWLHTNSAAHINKV